MLSADLHRPVGEPAGAPVILLHGGGQTRHAWRNAARRIADAGHVAITVDQRGHGESEWLASGAYTFHDYARDTVSIARQVAESHGEAPVLVGASLGGIASMMADTLGGKGLLSGLVLVDITPHMDPEGVSRIQGFMAERMREGFATLEEAAEAIASYLPHRKRPTSLAGLAKNLRLGADGRYRWHWDPAFIDGPLSIGTVSQDSQQQLVDAARQLSVPVLLVRGQQSELVTEEAVAAFRQLVPHASYADVMGAGHMVAGDRNDLFNEAVLDFLSTLRH